jgi:hypothetical protein
MKRLLLLLSLSLSAAAAALMLMPLSANAVIPRGYIDVSLKYGVKQFVLDQPGSKMLVVTNHSNVPMRNGWAVINGTRWFAKTPTGCHKASGLGGECGFRIKLLKPGKSIGFKVTFLFTTQEFPNGVFPGTNTKGVSVIIWAGNQNMSTPYEHVNLYFNAPE